MQLGGRQVVQFFQNQCFGLLIGQLPADVGQQLVGALDAGGQCRLVFAQRGDLFFLFFFGFAQSGQLGLDGGEQLLAFGLHFVSALTFEQDFEFQLITQHLEGGFDFLDGFFQRGKAVAATDTQREIVALASCLECHSKFAVHGGGRQDPKLCVTCHNDQRKYGNAEAAAGTTTTYTGSTYKINGLAVGDLPAFLHRLHMGKELKKTGYNYGGVLFNEVTYPQTITNCAKCHDGAKTAQGDNWKKVPSAMACGACHDGINFTTGLGTAINGDTAGHIGKAQADDSKCTLCHDAVSIPVYHVTVDPTGAVDRGGYPLNTAANVPTVGLASGMGPAIPLASQINLPAGVYKIGFEIKQVTVAGAAGAKKATVVYRILKDGAPVTLNATGFLMNNVDGTPSIYVGYGLPQDGITTPVDWNASITATVLQLRDKAAGNTQTGPDASGYYTATLAAVVPDAAKMVVGAIGINTTASCNSVWLLTRRASVCASQPLS